MNLKSIAARRLGMLWLLSLAAAAPVEIHVAPAGDDAAPGTADRPVRTLAKARDLARAQKARAVWLEGGTYPLPATLELSAGDSGAAGAPVVWSAKPGAVARISGGRTLPLSAFKTVTDPALLAQVDPAVRGKLVEADLKALGIADFGQLAALGRRAELFYRDRPLPISRWPNEGFATVADITPASPITSHGIKGSAVGKFLYEGDRPARWAAEKDALLHGYWFWDWSDGYQEIESIDPATRTIALVPPHHGYGYRKGQKYYALNLLCEIDQPGEWRIDRAGGKLHLLPPEDVKPGDELVLSTLERPLIALKDASHIILRGLTLETTRGGAIEIAGGTGNLVEGCTIRNVGNFAIQVNGGTDNGVARCEIHDTGGAGISISGGDRRTLAAAGNFATDNHIHHFARVRRTYAAAIHLAGVGNRAAHNLIHHAPHMAIGFSGNENVMELNEIHSVCQETGDVGVFYTGRDWTVRGNVIRHNFIHDVSGPGLHGAQGIYLDDAASGSIVQGNVLCRVARAMLIGGGRDNLIEGNIMVDCPMSITFDNRGLNWMKDTVGPGGVMPKRLSEMPYQRPPWSVRYPQLLTVLEDEPGSPKGNILRCNVIWRCKPMALAKEVTQHGTIADNVTFEEDPGFVNAAAMDFRLRPDAPLLRRIEGFAPVPIEQVGPRKTRQINDQ